MNRLLTPFTNPARVDDLELKHWVKADEADNQGINKIKRGEDD